MGRQNGEKDGEKAIGNIVRTMQKFLLIFHTVIYLKPIQIFYQLWYRIRHFIRKLLGFKYHLSISKKGKQLVFTPWIEKTESFDNYTFKFLNQTKHISAPFQGENQKGVSKLWAYNLNYMDYLLQPGLKEETGLALIDQFITNLTDNSIGIEPYPIALRGINWIKFFSKHGFARRESNENSVTGNGFARSDEGTTKQPHNLSTINHCLYAQYKILTDNLEYHLLGNHLLEDGFSLLFGAFYFKDDQFFKKARQIIETELKEQILDDGGHFELSPMYHQIILDRLLDCINLIQNNKRFETQDSLLNLMRQQAQKMLGWLNQITFNNGQIPLLNDSAPSIAPSTAQLKKYASSLNLQPATCNLQLSSSGYRRYNATNYECIIDIGQIGPTYQPGHAHADTFNFVLNINNAPFIVDTGISTYEANKTRLSERGTAAHNTVTVSGENSSQVWSSFRLAQRANVEVLQDEKTIVSARHNGYRKFGTTHRRVWQFNKNKIEITDSLKGKVTQGKAHFWLSPYIKPIKKGNKIIFENITLAFTNTQTVDIIAAKIPNGYNQFQQTFKIEVSFKEQLITTIEIK